uniref:STAM-binding protein n=1 Tax=Rhipicephalus appendiculatus TaxID=34631 RepID=A0A131Z1D1_RHIAP
MPSANRSIDTYDPKTKMRLLSDLGSAVDIDEDIPLKRYFRSGKEMVRMAEVYHKEGDLERTYILYTKYITLFVEKIYKHPAMKTPPVPDWDQTKKKLNEVFPIAEKLKAELLEKYTQEYKILLKNKERQEAEEALQEERRKKEQLERLMYEQQKQFALQQREQQAKMAQPERPETPTPPPGGISPSDVYPVLLELENGVRGTPRPKTPPFPTLSDFEVPDIPPRASKPSAPPSAPVDVVRRAIPAVDRSTKPLPLLSTELYYPSNQGLRTVVVPGGLFSKFLHLSRQNTEKNIETCAIMAGKFARNQLSITHLLVPKQSGTADSCFTESEEEMLEYQDELGLDTIGWVHTHPTQTAFMSSVDLHTHCSYQLMLPEAVAIVCSPKYEENKIFSLTVDHGLPFISGCRATGFHPHPNEPPLYEECRHVKVDEKAPITVVDLRG